MPKPSVLGEGKVVKFLELIASCPNCWTSCSKRASPSINMMWNDYGSYLMLTSELHTCMDSCIYIPHTYKQESIRIETLKWHERKLCFN